MVRASFITLRVTFGHFICAVRNWQAKTFRPLKSQYLHNNWHVEFLDMGGVFGTRLELVFAKSELEESGSNSFSVKNDASMCTNSTKLTMMNFIFTLSREFVLPFFSFLWPNFSTDFWLLGLLQKRVVSLILIDPVRKCENLKPIESLCWSWFS